MKHPIVSVVIPAFNSARTLDQTIESVVTQTFRDLELLVVDDGSSDATLEIARGWQARDDRVQVLQHPGGQNRGVAESRNLALDHAVGDYIAFLDSDDIWLPQKLERQLAEFAKCPEHVGVVFSNAWNSQTAPGQSFSNDARSLPAGSSQLGALFPGEPGSTAEHLLFSPATEFHNWVMSPTPLVRAIHFRDGLRFIGPPRLNTQFEDYLMWLTLSMRCEFVAIPEPLAVYRIHESQFVSRYCRQSRCLDYLRATHELLEILQQECRAEVERRHLSGRIRDRFNSVLRRLIVDYSRSTQTIRSVPLRDFPGVLNLAARTGCLLATAKALCVRMIYETCDYLRNNRITRTFTRAFRNICIEQL
ncbi:MAG: glycosyltransferase family 2 protein [Planctomycetes bacterium]|nr:glycosyltransferase family 2 protein [Planctomycetota bacterium]